MSKETLISHIVQSRRKFISERSRLLSLLYDIDLLPEQINTRRDAILLEAICQVWHLGETGKLMGDEPR